jgi:putative membrane protein
VNPHHLPLRVAALAGACAVVGVIAAGPAAADSGTGGVKVVNTETVQVYTSSSGQVQNRRVYEQLALTGNGPVDLSNPVSTDHLRNLDGFSGFTVKGGDQLVKTSVDGEKKLRTVSNFDGKLPLDVSVAYKLDGKPVQPGDVVGKSGHLAVTFTVQNITGRPQQVSFDDGQGGTVTKTVQVPIPIVGSLTTTAPASFTNVHSDSANMAGDGKGGTQLSFTMTLFPPIGSDTAVFGYDADITDGVVPRAEVSALPVDPLQSPTFKSAAGSYKGGADTGVQLTDGATQIDGNLLKLRDGAAKLLAGLLQLRDGAGQLRDGLTVSALPGSQRLAEGAGRLDTGLGQINSGSKRLAAGTGEAFAGSKTLRAGAHRLANGQQDLLSGVKLLRSGVQDMPAAVRQQLQSNPDYQAALAGLDGIVRGIGSTGDSPTAKTLLGGINAVQYGMRFPTVPANLDCGVALTGGTPVSCGAMDGVQFISEQLSSGASSLDQLKPLLQLLNATSNGGAACAGYPSFAPPPDPVPALPTPCQAVDILYYGLFGVSPAPDGAQAKVKTAAAALLGITNDVDTKLLGKNLPAGMLGGLDQLRFGLSNDAADPSKCAAAAATATPLDDCGIKQVALALQAGVPQLVDQLTGTISSQLLAGISVPSNGCDPKNPTLLCGARALADGGDKLAAGTDTLSAGLGRVDSGANDLADGASKAKDGSAQVAGGADQLASGLKDAAGGSTKLADGLTQAAAGAPKLRDGAQELSARGTKKLIGAGQSTAQDYGEMYATMAAGAQRARSESMAFGAPQGAVGLTAYDYVIQGDDGEGGRNLARGVGGLALLGAGAGAFALRRRLV